MAFLNELNSEDCGCDNNYFSALNESPLLSGSQENNFDPTNNSNNVLNYNNSNNSNNTISSNNSNNLNNNANNNILHNNNNKQMNNISNSELQQILGNNNMQNNNMQNHNHMQNNNHMQSNNQVSEQQIQNILSSIPNTNKRNSTQLPDIGSMRNNNEQIELTNQLNNAVNNSNAVAFNDGETQNKYISTMFNYVIVLLVALALNDLAKYYINRSIKFQNGTHMYYVYYSVGLVIVLYMISKYTNNL